MLMSRTRRRYRRCGAGKGGCATGREYWRFARHNDTSRAPSGRSGKPGSHPIQEAVEAEFEPFVARLRSIGIDTVIKDTDDAYEQA